MLMLAADTAGIAFCVWSAVWMLSPSGVSLTAFATLAVPTTIFALLLSAHQGFYHSIIRYVGMDVAMSGVKVTIASAIVLAVLAASTGVIGSSIRLAIAFSTLCLLYLMGSRYIARSFLNRRNPHREGVIVYGAGEAGARLVLSLQDGDAFVPLAIVDDNPALRGKLVGGLPVHAPEKLHSLTKELGASRVLLALPSASRRRRQKIISSVEGLSVHIQTVPELPDLVTGKARVDDIRDVEVGDLLGRETVPPDEGLLRSSIESRTVMITGAGGSIGSELCRQILRLGPKRIVLFELSEVALYEIDKELTTISRKNGIDCEIVALLGSVHHQDRVHEIMKTFRVNTVYHAAAYKHVPVVERNVLEGIHNNVFGTLHTARAATEANVDTFVLVSTDKAVSPTNVMGATKRLSEMVLQAMQEEHPAMRFCMVRFGNVLESSGSVVPLFREQIRAGGPVTVTHPDIIRYFMTIPEAAQLVIQASGMAEGGEVFVLDMGNPVRIQDLARRMIKLMGLTVQDDDNPDGDIEIQFTGLRPAEKLYEELLIGSDVSGTKHPRIMRANEEHLGYQELMPILDELKDSSQQLDRDHVREVLLSCVSGYKPTNGIDDLVTVRAKELAARTPTDKVVSLTQRSA